MKSRMVDIFFRLNIGEELSTNDIADKYGVSIRTISRDIAELKNFLAENRDISNNLELKYNSKNKTYILEREAILSPKELLFIIKILIESRSINKLELLSIIDKIKNNASQKDRAFLNNIIEKELYTYKSIKLTNEHIISMLWNLNRAIYDKKEITIEYYKMKGEAVKRKIKPIALVFSEYYFYLIAYRCDYSDYKPLFFRVDRIKHLIEHRTTFSVGSRYNFDEGELKQKIQFMTYGEYRKIKFEYYGKNVQAILDKLPTSKILDKNENKVILEALVYGKGINSYLLSQGSNIKVLEPKELIEELREEVEKIIEFYD